MYASGVRSETEGWSNQPVIFTHFLLQPNEMCRILSTMIASPRGWISLVFLIARLSFYSLCTFILPFSYEIHYVNRSSRRLTNMLLSSMIWIYCLPSPHHVICTWNSYLAYITSTDDLIWSMDNIPSRLFGDSLFCKSWPHNCAEKRRKSPSEKFSSKLLICNVGGED